MKPTRPLATAILILLSLSACGGTTPAAQPTPDAAAQQQFLEERKGTPDPNFTPEAGTGDFTFVGGPGMGANGKFGIVDSVDGRNITVTEPMNNTKSTIHLADDAKIMSQAEATLAELKEGDTIAAFGQLDGEILKADSVQLGGSLLGAVSISAPGSQVLVDGNTPPPGIITDSVRMPITNTNGSDIQSFPPGGPGSDGGPGGRVGPGGAMSSIEILEGKIDKIDGETITITSADGKTSTIQLSGATTYQKQAEIEIADLKTGTNIIATGEQKDDVYEATALRVMPAPQMINR